MSTSITTSRNNSSNSINISNDIVIEDVDESNDDYLFQSNDTGYQTLNGKKKMIRY